MSGLDDSKIRELTKLIDVLASDPNAEAFLAPVEWEELELLDYPTVVKNPMDLGTVKQRVVDHKYASFDECFADIQLIWDNCKLYNLAGSDIYRICERMEKSARRELNKFRQQHGLPIQSAATPAPTAAKRASAPQRLAEPEQSLPASTVVTVDMKMEFCSKIKKLPIESLQKFVDYTMQVQGSAVDELENEKVQIRVDDWEVETFDRVNAFVNELLLGSVTKRQRTE